MITKKHILIFIILLNSFTVNGMEGDVPESDPMEIDSTVVPCDNPLYLEPTGADEGDYQLPPIGVYSCRKNDIQMPINIKKELIEIADDEIGIELPKNHADFLMFKARQNNPSLTVRVQEIGNDVIFMTTKQILKLIANVNHYPTNLNDMRAYYIPCGNNRCVMLDARIADIAYENSD